MTCAGEPASAIRTIGNTFRYMGSNCFEGLMGRALRRIQCPVVCLLLYYRGDVARAVLDNGAGRAI